MAENDLATKDSRKNDNLEVNQQFLNQTTPNGLGINTVQPKFPQYACIAKRKDSYKSWPAYSPIKLDVLIEAGLVYTGVGDSVRCFHCGGGLRNWEEGDDPWVDHAKYFPQCPHVVHVKGQNYIDCVARGEKPCEIDMTMFLEKAEQEEIPESLLTVAAQSCREFGYSENQIFKAIQIFQNNNNGSTEFKAVDVLEIILKIKDVEENGAVGDGGGRVDSSYNRCKEEGREDEYPGISDSVQCNQCGGVSEIDRAMFLKKAEQKEIPESPLLHTVAAQSCRDFGYSENQIFKAIQIFQKNNNGSTEFKAENIYEIILKLEDVEENGTVGGDGRLEYVYRSCKEEEREDKDPGEKERLRKENKELKKNVMCKICLNHDFSTVFLPCGHLVSCSTCALAFVNCPTCGLYIDIKVKACFDMGKF